MSKKRRTACCGSDASGGVGTLQDRIDAMGRRANRLIALLVSATGQAAWHRVTDAIGEFDAAVRELADIKHEIIEAARQRIADLQHRFNEVVRELTRIEQELAEAALQRIVDAQDQFETGVREGTKLEHEIMADFAPGPSQSQLLCAVSLAEAWMHIGSLVAAWAGGGQCSREDCQPLWAAIRRAQDHYQQGSFGLFHCVVAMLLRVLIGRSSSTAEHSDRLRHHLCEVLEFIDTIEAEHASLTFAGRSSDRHLGDSGPPPPAS